MKSITDRIWGSSPTVPSSAVAGAGSAASAPTRPASGTVRHSVSKRASKLHHYVDGIPRIIFLGKKMKPLRILTRNNDRHPTRPRRRCGSWRRRPPAAGAPGQWTATKRNRSQKSANQIARQGGVLFRFVCGFSANSRHRMKTENNSCKLWIERNRIDDRSYSFQV